MDTFISNKINGNMKKEISIKNKIVIAKHRNKMWSTNFKKIIG